MEKYTLLSRRQCSLQTSSLATHTTRSPTTKTVLIQCRVKLFHPKDGTHFMGLKHEPCANGHLERNRRLGQIEATDNEGPSSDYFASVDDSDFADMDDLIPKQAHELSFPEKLTAAFRIFFPKKTDENARSEAKQRLRMILVADRCNMTPRSMSEMKKSIVTAISDYVEVDNDGEIDLSVSTHPDMGTVYSVSVPVKRVKTEYDPEMDINLQVEGISVVLDIQEDKEESSKKIDDAE
mmetsp:Transcript_15590/g.21548  ORF Transcript_15590/g.21548 Transcript_15590/m.21548 type:complete len:237 (+) Transcript_15590:79-789(+)|eukprot:CAMPEP_0196587708 /NCGR_PEP_ID=MMETSP1081-20130531/58346_1 /TAXON_ID=36882 /ORGANISM="Pyramimonas amylifera, Strain CCMP720" /LENGTH=236 /DNA_ID=CAMNT_0041909967 /DNA_START=76 /DNA_END=786 /DNA_ORIENTATION=+